MKVVLTQAAKAFVTPLTIQAVTGDAPHEELMDTQAEAAMGHIALARWADMILIAPASANIIAKLAFGFADDLLSTLCLATKASIILAPAMNQQMWLNPATQENIKKLLSRKVKILGPAVGLQACGEDGPGRMLEPHEIVEQLFLANENFFLHGKKIVITAGPTREPLDPVRYISNRSSGKMGYALAQAALQAGAEVTLISGPVALPAPDGCTLLKVNTAAEMLAAAQKNMVNADVFIASAAVSDYYLPQPAAQKNKKNNAASLNVQLEQTVDILHTISSMQPAPLVVGFAAETENVLDHGYEKLRKKGADIIIANDVSRSDIGFDSDFNEVTILFGDKKIALQKAEKNVIAQQILEVVCAQL